MDMLTTRAYRTLEIFYLENHFDITITNYDASIVMRFVDVVTELRADGWFSNSGSGQILLKAGKEIVAPVGSDASPLWGN